MISAWFLLLAFILGTWVGLIIAVLIVASRE